MKKKSIFLTTIVIIFSIILAACANKSADTAKGIYTPGTYTGTGEGKNGPIVAEVTFTKDSIEAIDIVKHSETDGLSDTSIKELPSAIVKSQSLGIDTVSGASMTNKGILDAISDAVKQAGGDPEALAKVEVKKEVSTEVVDLTTDIVIVGGGASGMSAALRAEELGYKTVLLEKMSYIGGAISISGGNQVVMGSDLQKEAGVTDDSVTSMTSDFMKNGANKNVPELLDLFAKNVGPTTDWLSTYVGIKYDMAGGLHKLAEYSHDRELAYTDGGAGFAKTARKAIEDSTIELHLNTKATEITTDEDGQITGVVAQEDTGKTFNITAKEVILAAGGYGNNKDLLSDNMKDVLYYGPESATGDGILMTEADKIKAATRLMEYGKTYPNGIEVSPGIAKSTINGNIAAYNESAILVNTKGKRVVNEKSSNRQILETEVAQNPKMLYLLMDESTFTIFKEKISEGGIGENDINKWLESNGATTPYFYHADTLAELAKHANMPAADLEATVKEYNKFVKAGEDKAFKRPAAYLKKEIGAGPYYLVEQKPRFATTMGGLVVNTELQVLNKDDKVIPGLYAVGEIAGGVMGDDSPSGANNAWALTSGKLAVDAIKAQAK